MNGALVLAICAALVLSGCTFGGGIAGSGRVISKEYPLSDFTGVDAASAFQVNLVRGDSFQVTVSADDNLFDYIKIVKEGSTLRIYTDSTPGRGIRPATLRADIQMPALDELRLSGATRASLSGFSSTRDLHLDVSGASRLNGAMDMGNARMQVSGASQVTLKGSVKTMTVNVSGASKATLRDLAAEAADMELSGASTATVHVRNNLAYNLSGASHLIYAGNPKIDRGQSSGVSSISRSE
ncbi:MAG: DUF2807 domain-containing protein [Chloroflexi bacterium]|nr:DUF2807 domain-containing protein [Chloroflexota bacterium]